MSVEGCKKGWFQKWKGWEGCFSDSIGASGGLGIMWKSSCCILEPLVVDSNFIWCKVFVKHSDESFFLCDVYGPSNLIKKRDLWSKLHLVLDSAVNSKIVVTGDFNATLSDLDKWGGIQWQPRSQVDFTSFVSSTKLVDMEPSLGWFTWNNQRPGLSSMAVHLDRFIVSEI
ncbi:hypothetical protein KI387_008240 [Taxus chinensis]|uniref:Endonuclease/exonuclease/phosphatase domain-containing protein n=1 Tax=Taxus chinensis TaxID=29808 RepID=A0AA38FIU4_TAXCH|nr:hypothetical protein KI387_008240 [Taxus chinensis]